jgi:hypothetical protein
MDHDRRRFLGRIAMTIAATPLGVAACDTNRQPRLARAGCLGRRRRVDQFATPDDVRMAGKVVLADFCTYTCINWLRTAALHSRVGEKSTGRD